MDYMECKRRLEQIAKGNGKNVDEAIALAALAILDRLDDIKSTLSDIASNTDQ